MPYHTIHAHIDDRIKKIIASWNYGLTEEKETKNEPFAVLFGCQLITTGASMNCLDSASAQEFIRVSKNLLGLDRKEKKNHTALTAINLLF